MFIMMLIIFIIILIFVYNIFGKDFMAPAIIVSAMYLLSALSALYNYEIWGLNNYDIKTVILILLGLISFIIGSFISYFIYQHKKDKILNTDINNDISIGKISFPYQIISIFTVILGIILKFIDMKKLFGSISLSNFSEIVGKYKYLVSNSTTYDSPLLLNQMDKIILVLAFINAYIIIKSFFAKKQKKHNLNLYIYLLLFIFYSLLSGGRMPILKVIAGIIFYIYCYSNIKRNWKTNFKSRNKILFRLLLALIVLFTLFPTVNNLMGRKKNFSADYYITMYTGGSLKLFDMYLDNPVQKSDIFGKETLYGINQISSKFSSVDKAYIKHLEFRYYDGLFLGNIYTPFRRYYSDFGITGVIALPLLMSLLINGFYLKIKKNIKNGYNIDFAILSYGIVIYTLFLYSIDDQFYTVVLSQSYASIYVYFFIIYSFIKRYLNSKDKTVVNEV